MRPDTIRASLSSFPNVFGVNDGRVRRELPTMSRETTVLERTDAPTGRPVETLDVAELGPPEPLRRTLELLADLPDETVLVQRNDRAPQFLFPRLEDRGYVHDTVEAGDGVVTAIWVEATDADEGPNDGGAAGGVDR